MITANAQKRPPHLRALPPGSDRPPPLSDEDLVEAVVSGDGRFAGQFYDRLAGVIGQTLYRIIGRRESDHEDLVQATFEQVIITLVKRRYAGACSLTTWASSLAAHVGLNALRSRKVERRILDRNCDLERTSGATPSAEDVERRVRAREEIAVVREHLARMKPDKAKTVVLHDVLGHDLAEVAVIEGITVAAAQSRLVRGRRELMSRLSKARAS